jgi:hypothetical protein
VIHTFPTMCSIRCSSGAPAVLRRCSLRYSDGAYMIREAGSCRLGWLEVSSAAGKLSIFLSRLGFMKHTIWRYTVFPNIVQSCTTLLLSLCIYTQEHFPVYTCILYRYKQENVLSKDWIHPYKATSTGTRPLLPPLQYSETDI